MRRLLLVEPDGRVTLCDLDSAVRIGLAGLGTGGAVADADVDVGVGVGADVGVGAGGAVGAGGGGTAGRAMARTAAWSPTGRWAACALDAVELDGVRELRVHHVDSGLVRTVASELSAFHVCPSPCGRYISHLSPGPLGLEFGVSDIETGELRVFERGQPLFWSWSPDSSSVAIHVEDRLLVVRLDGAETVVLSELAGSFLAPWWTPEGQVVAVSGDDRMISYGLDGSVTELGPCPSGRFAVDGTGRRVAAVDLLEGMPALVVLDLITGVREVVARERTAGFFWAPEGRRLAALVMSGLQELQWIVSDGERVVRLAPFRPGPGWAREVLPFFEQYAQGHSVWSADGSQLVAPALDAEGSPEVVVQTVSPPFVTERLPGARLAWWAD